MSKRNVWRYTKVCKSQNYQCKIYVDGRGCAAFNEMLLGEIVYFAYHSNNLG
jgi:hypothetical protein